MKSEYINCKNCKDDCRCRGKNITPICVSFTPVKTTKGDMIRGMSDEELTDMFWEFMTDSQFKNPYREKAELLDWLKSPAKEGEK